MNDFLIEKRIAERDAASLAAKNKERNQQILGIIAQKENEALGASSIEELRKLAETL